jgi:hypothetical protein
MTMNSHEFTSESETETDVVSTREEARPEIERSRREVQEKLDWHRAETERLRVLVDFLSHPIHAHGGSEPDPDIVTAYNLAVEAALIGIRHGAGESR